MQVIIVSLFRISRQLLGHYINLLIRVYDFKVIYRPGKSNANVDALSRKVNELDSSKLSVPTFSGFVPVQLRNVISSFLKIVEEEILESLLRCRFQLILVLSWKLCRKTTLIFNVFGSSSLLKKKPSSKERKALSSSVLVLLRQRAKIQDEDGILYRTVQYPGEGAIRQLLLPCRRIYIKENTIGIAWIDKCIYLLSSINYKIRNDLVPYELEAVCIEIIKPHSKPFFVTTVYRPPSASL